MLNKIFHFLKYNNAVIFIVLIIFLLGSGVFAQTEAGQNFIGQKQTNISGTDNTLLIELDLDKFNMDLKIEKIETDQKYYFVTYTYLDIIKKDNAWQYQMQEKTRKISMNIEKDLGVFLAEELSEQSLARIKELKEAQTEARNEGEQVRTEISQYSGLIGQTLELATKIFPDYDPVQKTEIPSPSVPALLTLAETGVNLQSADNLTEVYNDYIGEKDLDNDGVLGAIDNCPNEPNPDQIDSDNNGIGDVCEIEDIDPLEKIQNDASENKTVVDDVASSTEEASADNLNSPPTDEATTEANADPVTEPDVEIITIN